MWLGMMVFWWGAAVVGAVAAPRMTLTPATGTYNNGDSFAVTIGVNSESEMVTGMDVLGTFDAARLEIVSIEKPAAAVFNFFYDSATTPIINNTAGTFAITLVPQSASVHEAIALNGALLTVNFRAKSVGTATVRFTCRSGANDETNIINKSVVDVVDCSANQSGTYTIQGVGGDPSPTPTTVAGATATTRPTGSLPQTGGVGPTVGLVLFGITSAMAALFLRWL